MGACAEQRGFNIDSTCESYGGIRRWTYNLKVVSSIPVSREVYHATDLDKIVRTNPRSGCNSAQEWMSSSLNRLRRLRSGCTTTSYRCHIRQVHNNIYYATVTAVPVNRRLPGTIVSSARRLIRAIPVPALKLSIAILSSGYPTIRITYLLIYMTP